jgi:uncharacterized protein
LTLLAHQGCHDAVWLGIWGREVTATGVVQCRWLYHSAGVSAGALMDGKLCLAAERGDVAAIEWLTAAGADPNANEGTEYMTPLQLAAYHGHVAAIGTLLKAGACNAAARGDGFTALMAAAVHGDPRLVTVLLAAGADAHYANQSQDTALHWAVRYGRLDTASMLLDAGARVDVRDKSGKRPVDVVRAVWRSESLDVGLTICLPWHGRAGLHR